MREGPSSWCFNIGERSNGAKLRQHCSIASSCLPRLLLAWSWISTPTIKCCFKRLRRVSCPGATALRLIHGAVRLSAARGGAGPGAVCLADGGAVARHRDKPGVAKFVDEITAAAPRPWFRPLHPCLDAPGGALLRTLEGHTDVVNGVAVTPDGKRAVSASRDKTLKVWDLDTGRALRTLEGHSDRVDGVAVTADGKRAVSAS